MPGPIQPKQKKKKKKIKEFKIYLRTGQEYSKLKLVKLGAPICFDRLYFQKFYYFKKKKKNACEKKACELTCIIYIYIYI